MPPQKKTKKPTHYRNFSDDPVSEYAQSVVDGVRTAGPHVRGQCARHLRDLTEGAKRGLVWSVEESNKALRFYSNVLKLNGGDFEGKPFELLPWQKFVVGSLFGWQGADGYRRFRVAYVETAKGSGKSPLAAGIGMKGLVADNEPRAEIYSAATKKDQAMILFRDAVAMVDQSPELSKRLQKSGTGERCWNLAYMAQGAFFRPISSDDGQSGPRPHIGLIDELHEHKTNTVVEMMRAGTKSRRQALIFMITNAGHNRMGPCWGYHEYGAKVAAGEVEDDAFFPFVCSLDEARKVTFSSVDDAGAYIIKVCLAKTTQIEKSHPQDSALLATSKTYSNGNLMLGSDARITQIEQLLQEAFAKAVTTHSDAQKTRNTSANGMSPKTDGLRKTGIKHAQQESGGELATGPITGSGTGLKSTASRASSTSKYSKNRMGLVASVASRNLSFSELITAMIPGQFEDFFATNATLESVCWEITRNLFSALSPICSQLHSAKISGDSLVVDFPADDPFADESCWSKANPSLQDADLPGMKYIREQVVEAKGMPSKEAIVRRLNFCQWTDAESPWISGEIWRSVQREFDWRDLRGRRAYAGLDLSSTTDLTGMVFLVEPEESGEPWLLVPFAWLPDVDLQRKADTDRVPYIQWRAEGLLETTPGRAISKRIVLQKLSAMCEFFDVVCVGYDRWRIEDLMAMASDEGITLPEMKPVGQGYRDFSPAVETFERMLLNGEIAHPGHKVLDWCMSNAVIEQDGAENRKLSKEKATGRIDLAVAAVMAAGLINSAKPVVNNSYLNDCEPLFL